MSLSVHQKGHDAVGIDGMRIQGVQIVVLFDLLLQNAEILLRLTDVFIHGINGIEVGLLQLLDALSALTGGRLREDHILILHKLCEILRRHILHTQEIPVQEILVKLVEDILPIEDIGLGLIIYHLQHPLVAKAGDVGISLSSVHIVKGEDQVVMNPRTITYKAPQHVQHGFHTVLTAFFLGPVHDILKPFEASALQNAEQVSDFSHCYLLPIQLHRIGWFHCHKISRRTGPQRVTGSVRNKSNTSNG